MLIYQSPMTSVFDMELLQFTYKKNVLKQIKHWFWTNRLWWNFFDELSKSQKIGHFKLFIKNKELIYLNKFININRFWYYFNVKLWNHLNFKYYHIIRWEKCIFIWKIGVEIILIWTTIFFNTKLKFGHQLFCLSTTLISISPPYWVSPPPWKMKNEEPWWAKRAKILPI